MDKRLILLQIISHLDGGISNKAMQLLKSLAEIEETLYTSQKYRNPQKLLRLTNITITPRKLFGAAVWWKENEFGIVEFF